MRFVATAIYSLADDDKNEKLVNEWMNEVNYEYF